MTNKDMTLKELSEHPELASEEDLNALTACFQVIKEMGKRFEPLLNGVTMDSGRSKEEIAYSYYVETMLMAAILESFTIKSEQEFKEINKFVFNYTDKAFIWDVPITSYFRCVTKLCKVGLLELRREDKYNPTFTITEDVFVTSGFGNALIQKKETDNLDFSSVFFFNIGFSICIYIILFLAAPAIADFYEKPILCAALRVLALRIIIAAINSVQQAYVSRNMLFKRFFWSTLFGTLFSGLVGIAMAYQGFGIWALVAQYLTNTCVDTVVLWFTVRWRPNFAFSIGRLQVLITYGWKILVSGLLDTGYNQLRSLIIGKMYSSSDLAQYNKGQQFPQLIVTNINTSISGVLFPAIAQCQDDMDRVRDMTRRAIKVSSFVMWPLMVGLAVVAEPLISVMLTDKWLPCVPFLYIACFTFGLWPIHTANLEAMKAVGRSDLFLKLEIIKKIMGLAVLLVSMRYGVMAIAASQILTSIISTFINAFPNQKLLKYKYTDQIRDMLPSFLLALLMGGLIYPVKCFAKSKILLIGVQVILGAIVYVAGAKLFRNDSFVYLISIVNNRRTGKAE